jgi:hypothetical protein
MGRSDGRTNSHVQEKKPPPAGNAPAAALPPEERQAILEGAQPGWRWAAMIWAVVFLFLTALMLFDLVAGLLTG